MPKVREEVANLRLADLLCDQGFLSEAETIVNAQSVQLPDIRLSWRGIEFAIECKFDRPGARAAVENDAQKRLETNLAAIAVAILYPDELSDSATLNSKLLNAPLQARFYSVGRAGDWLEVDGVSGLASALDSATDLLVADSSIEESATALNEAVDLFRGALNQQAARKEALLGVVTAESAVTAGVGSEEDIEAAVAIAGLALCTASLLQSELSRYDSQVPPLPPPNVVTRATLLDAWNVVLEHDYAAVFGIAAKILDTLVDDPHLDQCLQQLTETASSISSARVLGRHDLVGRIYHTLLADQKYLATYYTRVASAALLNGVALDPSKWTNIAWSADPNNFNFSLGDFACGTGTLLVSAASNLTRSWAYARAQTSDDLDLQAFGRRLLESQVHGYDVLAYAVQVCATTLLLSSPGVPVTNTNLFQMPFGGEDGLLGSLELLRGDVRARLFGDVVQGVTPDDVDTLDTIEIPQLDYVVMNPPFTRSNFNNELLGSLEGAELALARTRLRGIVSDSDIRGQLTGGLAVPFTELGLRAVKEGGRIALVLPRVALTGSTWSGTRAALAEDFHLEDVVVSHEYDHWNFSDSTQLSEVLLIARRRIGERPDDEKTRWTQLTRNPRTPVEGLVVAAALNNLPTDFQGAVPIQTQATLDGNVGEAFLRPSPSDGRPWRHAVFSSLALDEMSEALVETGRLVSPGHDHPITLKSFGELASFGPDTRDIHDGFHQSDSATGFEAFWNHNENEVTRIKQNPNRHLVARTTPLPNRPLKDADELWAASSPFLIAERFWLLTHRCVSVLLDRRVLANTWWEVSLNDGMDTRHMRALNLWLNSSLGILSVIYSTESARGPWINLKKGKLPDLPVLDVTQLSDTQLDQLSAAFEEQAENQLLAIAQLASDPTRHAIDRALANALEVPESHFETVRQLIESEPFIQDGHPEPEPSTDDPLAEQPEVF